jgi:heterodisulfide reductase subunit A-like polyferredoxin
VAACPSGAAHAWHYSDQQIFAEIEGLLFEAAAPLAT